MGSVFANRNSKSDFIINEVERRAKPGCNVYIAAAFFTHAEVIEQLAAKGCNVYLVVRLGFPTSPDAIETVLGNPRVQMRSYTGRTFHPKLYLFGDEVALVGSANLTRAAMVSNQEVVVAVESPDDRILELMEIFEDYWDGAEVVTAEQLNVYRPLYKRFSKLENEVDQLSEDVLRLLGDRSPGNIERTQQRQNKHSLFLSNFRRTYQEAVVAFNIVRGIYEASGYRKASEAAIPIRIEIDSFLSYVRERVAPGDKWAEAPLRTNAEQEQFIRPLIAEWEKIEWPHFERRIVGTNYPRLQVIFKSESAVMKASDGQIFDALATLHSFHDRFRFFDGGLETWKRTFAEVNDPDRVRETLSYLVHGSGDVVERMANCIYDERYKLNEFGPANVHELVGWCNQEELPILNGRTTKVLRFFGSRVRQL